MNHNLRIIIYIFISAISKIIFKGRIRNNNVKLSIIAFILSIVYLFV